jgi:uncharacterized protein YuzE
MMHQAFDADADALYITLAEKPWRVHRTVAIDDSTNVDLDADGTVLGIEVLSPSRPWPLAEILQQYEIARDDAAMLVMVYRFPPSVEVV